MLLAHYEPRPLAWDTSYKAALLCQAFHSRPDNLKMSRTSADHNEMMAMCGMRVPRSGVVANGAHNVHYGRYSGDEGPEADQFSLATWPYLSTVGGFKAIANKWMQQLPGMMCSVKQEAASESASNSSYYGPQANYPIPTLLGSPFTTLAVTQNYHSWLHAEPEEHPFSYITWLDVLNAGSKMEVGYFWLTNGLAFTPQNGSALYIDVRLVPHCSDLCTVYTTDATRRGMIEGRYGAALFIKPPVMAANIQAWSALHSYLDHVAAGQLPYQIDLPPYAS